ncbi:MAG TPA: STAS domain-containing protein [Kiritimatiellia bacterium]|nr:STAS domain-containing protein [Kiritimatiellia bacterium]HNR93808.1 STAS domain-containing protein [Kiritimatiellia bacterium]HNS81185.1 STAS domain-containing protein [Kiritimatiellia bacterium]HPA78263.1 STAS domain-containing protein [Kiritimatiellia bacterium]HQQ04749.1 STAS domain-containing protein [Kiritimatiellia bacterium]
MKECVIQREENGQLDILHLDGSLDAYSFPRLETALNQLRENSRNRVVLDCEGLDYISSAALGALIGFARRAREQNGDLKLAKLSAKIYNIVELLGFHKILEIHPEVGQAVSSFAG